MDDTINYRQIALLNRAYMAEVWRKVNENEDLSVEEELLAEQMQAHPEFSAVWESKEQSEHLFDPACEENPFLHVSLHVMLERQINSGDPPCVRQTAERLEALAEDPHEARHAMLRILVAELWQVMTQKRPFDVRRYCEQLRGL